MFPLIVGILACKSICLHCFEWQSCLQHYISLKQVVSTTYYSGLKRTTRHESSQGNIVTSCYTGFLLPVLYRFFIASVRIPEQYTTVCSKLLLSYSNSLCETFLVSDFALLVTLVAIVLIMISYLMRCHKHHTHGVLKLHLSTIVHPVHTTN